MDMSEEAKALEAPEEAQAPESPEETQAPESPEETQAPESPEKSRALEAPVNPNVPELRPGDSVSVHVLIKEGTRERVQEFKGTIIRMRKGGNNANFTVRRIASHGIGVERSFLLRSPRIQKVEVQRQSHVRRAQLYFLRERTGKRARLKEKRRAS
jgi:large subunit ribosomal protein L19